MRMINMVSVLLLLSTAEIYGKMPANIRKPSLPLYETVLIARVQDENAKLAAVFELKTEAVNSEPLIIAHYPNISNPNAYQKYPGNDAMLHADYPKFFNDHFYMVHYVNARISLDWNAIKADLDSIKQPSAEFDKISQTVSLRKYKDQYGGIWKIAVDYYTDSSKLPQINVVSRNEKGNTRYFAFHVEPMFYCYVILTKQAAIGENKSQAEKITPLTKEEYNYFVQTDPKTHSDKLNEKERWALHALKSLP